MKDPHDPREFRQWVSLDDFGNVLAMHEFEAQVERPLPTAVDVTNLGPVDWFQADAKALAPLRAERAVLVADLANAAAEEALVK